MPRLGFAIDNRACIGCHACTVACKSEHGTPLGVNRTWVKYIEKGTFPNTRRHFSVQRCNHCDDAPCVEICPVTSLYRRPDGIVDFDNSRCIGCKACMQACPYDALYLDPATNTAAKCNYCTHRIENGYEPACVIVCPVEAIVSGDLDDPGSRIAQLDRLQKVQYPKPEKNTRPKLFYVGGETAAIDPTAAPPATDYLWSGNAADLRPSMLEAARDESEEEARARRVYDPRSKPLPWGWMVSAYITTKAIASGVVMIALGLFAANLSPTVLPTAALLTSLLFLGLTGVLLVADLKQPQRFLYVLLRPQWKSWLVRGAYLITAFGLLTPVVWLVGAAGASRESQLALGAGLAILAASVAVYTALLLAQARGRDSWQNPLLVVSMLADALVGGAAAGHWIGLIPAPAGEPDIGRGLLLTGAFVQGLLVIAELLPRPPTRNAALTHRLMIRGPLSGWLWVGVVALGVVAPIGLLWGDGPVALAAFFLLLGIAARNHLLVQAPQRVPLS